MEKRRDMVQNAARLVKKVREKAGDRSKTRMEDEGPASYKTTAGVARTPIEARNSVDFSESWADRDRRALLVAPRRLSL